ncbi:MAG: S8 family serine peptidase [Dehalococcoidia bacterium]|nr:S8 family serine peptidase [Dehalococcoidia bacterium]
MLKRTGIILSIMVTMALVSAISLSFGVRPATADDAGQVNLSPVELPEKGNLKLSSKLTRLISANEHAEAEEFARPRGIELVDGSIRVIIECLAGEVKAVAEAAGALGVVQLTTRRLVQAVVPITSLTALADTPGIRFVRLPWRPVLEEEVVSQGVDLIEADEWHTAGFDGTGVKVGILDTGFAGYSALLGSELPNDNDVEENWGPGGEGNSDHGTACAEIVYDIAEGAQFYLAKYGTDAEFEDAVDWFIEEEVDVISCSGSYPAKGPGDGTGPICEVVDAARAAGIVWSQAVGNYAQRHWEGPFVDTDTDGRHDFRQNPRDESNTVAVELGDKILVFLNWDDTWGESGNDYDLYLYNKFGGQPVARGDDVQDGDDDPYEWLEWTATYTGNYRIYIDAWGEPDVVNLSLYSVKINLEYQVASSSFVVPADSPNAMAVGAVHWDTPTEIEDYSSRGPTTDDRKKPDLVAPTCVETATDNSFCGTSAATPHAAGAAVLVKECYSSYAPAGVQSLLENNAVELGAAGKDNVLRRGRL